jgi:uncharacterized membrane protein YhaH (DUF805 family)
MNIQQAVQTVYKNYFNFGGRSRRSEFWYFILFTFLVQIALALPALMISKNLETLFGIVSGLFSLFNVIPSFAVTFRRLHDAGKSAWNLLWMLLPILGQFYVLYLYCKPSDSPNRWGSQPISPNQF